MATKKKRHGLAGQPSNNPNGRPREEGAKRGMVFVRVSEDERLALDLRAERAGMPLSVWIREQLFSKPG